MDGFQEILYTLRQNKLRTLLTAFGVFWGIFILVLLVGAGRGMQNGVTASFGSDSLDSIIVSGGTTAVAYEGLGLGRSISFTQADVAAIRSLLPQVLYVSGENSIGTAKASYMAKSGTFDTLGIDDEYFFVKDRVLFSFGRKMNPLDHVRDRKVAFIGRQVADRLFGYGLDPTGEEIQVNNVRLKVVGVFHDKGNNGRNSERIYVPYSTFQVALGARDTIGAIWIKPKPGSDSFALESDVVDLLKRRHHVAAEDRRAISSFNMAEPAKMVHDLFSAINALIWFVGLGTLTAGIVGISNIMIITVKDRTREIGVRKALGAPPRTIVGALLMESVFVTATAGYIGLVAGIALVELMALGLEASGAEMPYFANPEVDLVTTITAAALLIVVGALAGLMPALKAARVMPVEAMRA